MGARLCSKAELEAGCTAGTGCAHDGDMIWTSEPCIWVPADGAQVSCGNPNNGAPGVDPIFS